ncbi:hypothetical protein J3P88_16610 [Pseudomonas sp. Z3-6]|uniref:hypothetical protein n=1 Tax=Pseudomonas sp. Z3-6 TaxID=2817411 RepID=UPI003DA85E8C
MIESQLIDKTCIFPAGVDFPATMRNLLHTPSCSTLTPMRKLSILCWYGFLARQIGTTKAGSLERHFEPSAISIGPDGCTEHKKNKWRHYRDGLHKPQTKLVRDVDSRAQGSARILEHPLWRICDPNNKTAAEDPEFIRQLNPKIQQIICPNEAPSQYFRSNLDLSRKHRRALCKTPSLDSLAAVTWIIRSSLGLTTTEPSQTFYAAHDILMTLSAELYELGIASPLLDHYIKWILPLALPKGLMVDFAPSDYILISLFTTAFIKAEIHSRDIVPSKVKVFKEIFLAQDLKKDFNLFFALSARFARIGIIEENGSTYDYNTHNKIRHKALTKFMDPSLVGYLTSGSSRIPAT